VRNFALDTDSPMRDTLPMPLRRLVLTSPALSVPEHREFASPVVVANGFERCGLPPPTSLMAEADVGREFVVAIGEDVRLHGGTLSEGSLRRVVAVVDGRSDAGGDGPGPAEGRGEVGGRSGPRSGRLRDSGSRCVGRRGPRTRSSCAGW